MASINSVVLCGRLTREVELRKTTAGISYCRFTVACDRPKKKDDQESTADFISCVAWRQNADFITGYGRKGDYVGVTGSIQTGSYTDRDGRKVYTTEVLSDRIQLFNTGNGGGQKPERSDYPHNGTSVSLQELTSDPGVDQGFEISGDDLPF